MADLLMNSLRDELRKLRADVDMLRRHAGTGTFVQYTPTFSSTGTQPVLGTGGLVRGWWTRLGDLVIVDQIQLEWGSAGVTFGTGQYFLSLPTPAEAPLHAIPVGRAFMIDSGVLGYPVDTVLELTADKVSFMTSAWGTVGPTSPFTFGTLDQMRIGPFSYRAAIQ